MPDGGAGRAAEAVDLARGGRFERLDQRPHRPRHRPRRTSRPAAPVAPVATGPPEGRSIRRACSAGGVPRRRRPRCRTRRPSDASPQRRGSSLRPESPRRSGSPPGPGSSRRPGSPRSGSPRRTGIPSSRRTSGRIRMPWTWLGMMTNASRRTRAWRGSAFQRESTARPSAFRRTRPPRHLAEEAGAAVRAERDEVRARRGVVVARQPDGAAAVALGVVGHPHLLYCKAPKPEPVSSPTPTSQANRTASGVPSTITGHSLPLCLTPLIWASFVRARP